VARWSRTFSAGSFNSILKKHSTNGWFLHSVWEFRVFNRDEVLIIKLSSLHVLGGSRISRLKQYLGSDICCGVFFLPCFYSILGYLMKFSVAIVYSDVWQDDWWIVKDLEGRGCGLINTLSRHFPGQTEKNQKSFSQNILRPGRDSNRASLENDSSVLPTCQTRSAGPVWQISMGTTVRKMLKASWLNNNEVIQTLWLWSARELYRPSDRRLSARLVPTFADRGVAWSAQRIPTAVNLGSLDPEPLVFNSSSSSVVLTRLSGPRSWPTTSQKIW
jgi:hypothetical protein